MDGADLEIKMGPFDENRRFCIEIKAKAPMLMEQVACVLYELFKTHCRHIKVDPADIIKIQEEAVGSENKPPEKPIVN